MKFASVDALSELVWSPHNGHKMNTRVIDHGECFETTDENNLTNLAAAANKDPVSLQEDEKAGTSGSYKLLGKAKGKEIAISDGDDDDDDDDKVSLRSVESCNSAGLVPRGKKREGFEDQLLLGSKRVKALSQDCLGSTSKVNQDSSFMNWISNMTKGIWKGNEEDNNSPVLALTTTSDANGQAKTITDQQESSSLLELPCLPEQCLIRTSGDHLSSFDNEIGPVVEPKGFNKTNNTCSSENKELKAGEKVDGDVTNRNSGLESLWIRRFSSRSFPQKKDLHERITNEAATEASDSEKVLMIDNNVISASVSKLVEGFDKPKLIHPIVSSMRTESSEAMAAMFARRLEALKHIMPFGSLDENSEKGQMNLRCLYCGKKDHSLQSCLEVTDNELRDLVQNIGNRKEEEEEASSLCIRCFQLSHWAATCPNAPHRSPGSEDRETKHVPKAVFDSVQLLRLTRTDFLKWMNTKESTSGLEGFFLRLRVGKGQEGMGATGYYVARIDGAKEGQSIVYVKVRGMTCSVESRFISNHNFLEEELKAWWQSLGKGAGRNCDDGFPSEEELSRKIHQRKLLGF